MEEDGCMPNYCSYNVIIRGFLLHKDTSKARKLNEMVNRGFSADSDTKTLLGDLFPVDGSAALKKLLVPSEGCQAITYHDPGSTFAGASLVCIATPFDNLEPEAYTDHLFVFACCNGFCNLHGLADKGYQGAFEVHGVFPRILKHSKFLL
ncbi:hypothetical protein POTOM_019047 [Populus tomentosa]|uniref:Pentatricopeptide repeat-containing protein n=1 Tax=Populus tomentosa TaxID=118781 RepID=A0A8X8A6T4_POPTO|nr:hypothetical protein POTOM_019047 [Populus tomentosa]